MTGAVVSRELQGRSGPAAYTNITRSLRDNEILKEKAKRKFLTLS